MISLISPARLPCCNCSAKSRRFLIGRLSRLCMPRAKCREWLRAGPAVLNSETSQLRRHPPGDAMAERVDKVEAVVLKIDFPQGQRSTASEAMWQAVRRVAKTKPVIISVRIDRSPPAAVILSRLQRRLHFQWTPSAHRVGSIGVVEWKIRPQRSHDQARHQRRQLHPRQKRRPLQHEQRRDDRQRCQHGRAGGCTTPTTCSPSA